jgi:glycosyltransferase involved in cell wall biosynthesis
MRVLHFSTSDGPGGAGKAALRLHQALQAAGHHSRLLVRRRASAGSDATIVPAAPLVERLYRLKGHLPGLRPAAARFTFNHDLPKGVPVRRALAAVSDSPDAVCLHWVATFLTSGGIRAIHEKLRCPLVWVMMDQEPVTGGCHYSFGCEAYRSSCGRCPILKRPSEHDRSRVVFLRKRRYLADLPITFVAPTSWVAARVRESALFGSHRVQRIPLAIDTCVYRPGDGNAARRQLGISVEKRIVFFGSSYLHEPRKGGAYLVEALHILRQSLENSSLANPGHAAKPIEILMAGRHSDELTRQLSFPAHNLGYISDDATLATAYRASDVFVCPSIEDAGPMMIPEAMLCGTPVVAFNTGGAPDLVRTGETGYLTELRSARDLARGVEAVLFSSRLAEMGQTAARRASLLHEPRVVAEQYANLIAELQDTTVQRRAA